MALVRSLAVFAFVIAFTIVGSTPAGASHSWGSYHWGRMANPFTLQLVNSTAVVAGGANWPSILSAVSIDWTLSSVLNTNIEPGSTALKDRKQCRAVLGKVRACNATYGFNGWLGLATIWISGSHITQGTAKVNDSYFNTATYNTPLWRQYVMCQEIGHTFGLGHTSEDGSNQWTCMDYSGKNAHPNQHDYDQLVTIYGTHFESNTFKSAQSQTGAGHANPAAGFAEDGTPVGASRARGDVYVTDLGGGRRIVTFITWAR